MEDLIETLSAGHVTEVKIVLTTVVSVLAIYQVLLMVVGWGWIRLPFFSSRAASFTHRSAGDAITTVTLLVGFMCYGYFGIEDGIAVLVDFGSAQHRILSPYAKMTKL